VECDVVADYFKPRGIPLSHLEEIELSMEELESIRLADHEGLYHEEASSRMEISRATFGRLLEAARRKVAGAIVSGKAVKIVRAEKKEGSDEIVFSGRKGRRLGKHRL